MQLCKLWRSTYTCLSSYDNIIIVVLIDHTHTQCHTQGGRFCIYMFISSFRYAFLPMLTIFGCFLFFQSQFHCLNKPLGLVITLCLIRPRSLVSITSSQVCSHLNLALACSELLLTFSRVGCMCCTCMARCIIVRTHSSLVGTLSV